MSATSPRRPGHVWQRVAVWDARRAFSSLPDHEVVGLPALSPTMETGTIAKWMKKEGELVAAGDIICQVETDKAVVDFEAQDDFHLAKILKPEGTADIKVGEPIFVSVMEASDVGAFAGFSLDAAAPARAAEPAAPAPAAAAAAAPVAAPAQQLPVVNRDASGRIIASPLAKKIARESGVLLAAINGTGPHGRIVKADVEDALARGVTAPAEASTSAAAPAAASAAPVAQQPISTHDYTDYPISLEAQAYAQQLTQQKLDVPHFHLTVDLTVDKLLQARDRLNAGLKDDAKLSVNDFLVRAASLAMKKVPEVNSAWKGSFIRQYHDTNVNVVVSTAAGGSVSPVIARANQKGLVEISEDMRALVSKAGESALSASDLAAGTFTMSNVGMFDVRSFAGIVSPDQACFLGLGTIEKKVVPNDDPNATQIYKYAQVMTATLACDHRVVDGAVGAQWLAVFKELVEDPLKMIL
ncbi:hypothetical protein ATCC90586_008477 [Pythium insidiosum]|nr:hypothetical protein ATCC90586_008477 [Pythium insidiosum]